MVRRLPEELSQLDDHALVVASRLGRDEAIDELYRRYAPLAWRAAVAVTIDDAAAADAVARGFAEVLMAEGPDRASTAGGLAPAVLRATRAAAVESLRRASGQAPQAPGTAPRASGGDGLDRSVAAVAFRSLPERWRSVLWLSEVEGTPPSQAAAILGVSADGVPQLAARARAGLGERSARIRLASPEATPACRTALPALPALAAGSLAPRDAAGLERHLAGCQSCRDQLAEQGDVGSALRQAMVPLPVGLLTDALARWKVAAAGLVAGEPVRGGFSGARKPLVSASLGLLALGIIGAAVVGESAGPQSPYVSIGPAHSTRSSFPPLPSFTTTTVRPPTGLGGQLLTATSAPTTVAPPPAAPAVGAPSAGGSAAPAGGGASAAATSSSGPAANGSASTGNAAKAGAPAGSGAAPPAGARPGSSAAPPATTPPLQVAVNARVAQAPVALAVGTCTGLQVATVAVGCTAPAGPATSSPGASPLSASVKASLPLLGTTSLTLP